MNQNFTYKRKGSRGVHPKMKNCAIIYCTLNREMTHTLKKSCQAPQGFKKHHKSSLYESYSKSSEAIQLDFVEKLMKM